MVLAVDDEELKEEESEEAQELKGKGSSKKLLIIIILAVILLGGAAAGYFFFLRGPAESETTEATDEEGADTGKEADTGEDTGEEAATSPAIKSGIIFALDHFIVNINDASGETRYLKIEIKLELENEKMQTEVENRAYKIRDSVVTILTNKSVDEISDTNGKLRLKEEIKARLNSFLTLGKITEVYFTDFIIQ